MKQTCRTLDSYFQRPYAEICERTMQKLLGAGIDPLVARIELELIKKSACETLYWNWKLAELAELEYKRMLTLLLWNPRLPHPIVTVKFVDQFWHLHILDSRAYHADMNRIFGRYLHHFPYLGIGSMESIELWEEAFELSCALYKETFGEAYGYICERNSDEY